MTDDRDEGDAVEDAHLIGMHRLLDLGDDLLQNAAWKVRPVDDEGHGVDARRDMFEGNAVVFEHGQDLAGKADLEVHERLFHEDDGKVLLSGDTRDRPAREAVLGRGHDERALVFGAEGILDADGDIRLAHGEDGLAVENVRAHVGKLAQLLIGKRADGHGVFDDAGIARKEAAHVRPVLIERCPRRARHDGARDIRAAAGERLDLSVRALAVKARDERLRLPRKSAGKELEGAGAFQLARCVELDDVARVDERDAQKRRHDAPRKVLPAGRRKVGRLFLFDRLFRLLQDAPDVEIDLELLHDARKAGADLFERLAAAARLLHLFVRLVEKVGDFDVAAEPLPGRRNDDVSAFGIALKDVLHAPHGHAVRHGRAAEFANLNHN